ncbi:beta-glucosidase [Penicillium sp. IBT 35674x]|nr:beta-glucosidase [Penicillium sp. IBT 35674x]
MKPLRLVSLFLMFLFHDHAAEALVPRAEKPTYSTFSYTQVTSDRYPTALKPSLTYSTPFAPSFGVASTLLPTDVTYTTYSLNPSATSSMDGKYGQSAYAAMWGTLSYSNIPPFTTTVSPTPVAKKELVYPPDLPFQMAPEEHLTLPSDFVWGVAGSSWQIEGGLQLEGRGPSIVDLVGAIGSNETIGAITLSSGANDSNVADMNYFLYKQDLARLAAMGIPYYSFSVSWGRVMPFGVAGSPVNQEALNHYEDLIQTCLEYGIKPIVTLFHFDLPTTISIDEPEFQTHFLYYAKQVMTRYADRVPFWITVNEINMGPGLTFQTYNAMTVILQAHAAVYDWYKSKLKGIGQISMKFGNNLAVPLDPSDSSHISAALRYQDFELGILGNPLFLGKQYPADVLSTPKLGLTALTQKQISSFHGKIDFLAIDPYVAQYASPAEDMTACLRNSSDPLWPYCAVLTNVQANGWLMGDGSEAYPYIAPQYVRQQLGYLWNTFKPSAILVAEFGFPVFAESQKTVPAQQYDLERTLYYQGFLHEVLKAIHKDGVNVIGTIAWSFLDNNELGTYDSRYGMQSVNRTDGLFTRTYKRTIFDFVDFFRGHMNN